MVSCIWPPSTAWSLWTTGFCLAFWRGRCAPWIPPWVFFLVRSAESWNCLKPRICLEYPSLFALESLNCWLLLLGVSLLGLLLPLLSFRLLVSAEEACRLSTLGCDPVWEDKRSKQWFIYLLSCKDKSTWVIPLWDLNTAMFITILSRTVYNFYKS